MPGLSRLFWLNPSELMNCFVKTLLLLFALTFLPFHISAQARPSLIKFDLDRDGKPELIVLDGEKDQTLSVRHGRRLLWQGVTRRWKPWKIMVADVDGDGQFEIVVGVYKPTRFFPKPHNCLFVYGWDGKRAFPKWLGSTLSKPFTDFTFADLNHDGHQELVAVETARDRKQWVAVYSWNGFGFTLDWQRGGWASARLVAAGAGDVIVEADGERIVLTKE